ncbi:uncharacterized protein LOC128877867 [Hylaeus volcanicus]|uniref:uncharacterized protein LOC128877867 n=1 Tax=Hylaeus volcanicus TaxID=313075 RepID=UPI0023B81F95|nr:uncharacterized protein LOC128877867 [Hylaeus volcanicus]
MAQETPLWLNTHFAERILRLAEDNTTITVTDIFMKPATSKGDNYTSDMMRVSIEFTRVQDGERVKDKKSLIFKFEPIEEGVRRDLIEKVQIFDTEMTMMMDTLKKMNDMLGPESRLGAEVYHVRMERPLCLIMEDLAPLGFRMADRQAGLDLQHCLLAVRGLAKFHASSVVLCEKEPKHKERYRRGIFSDEFPDEVTAFFIGGCAALAAEMKNWPGEWTIYREKLEALAPHLFKLGSKTLQRRDDEFNVINHGDSWVNNMLFRYDENSKPVQHIFVDFQMCVYTTPAIDLHYFLSTSPSDTIYENNLDMLVEEYVRTLSTMMKQLGSKTKPPTLEDIKRVMKEREAYALISSITVLPVILVDKSEAMDIDEMMHPDGVNNPGYRSPIYQKVMAKRFPKFLKAGLLEIPA